jgi:hypothetical protein
MVMSKDMGGARGVGGISGGGGRNVTPVYRELSPSAQKSIAEARKALGASKPDPQEIARRQVADRAREAERIRRQGRNTR